jgi:hypothetical protein
VVLPNDQQLLARRNIVAWSHVSHADIADIQALHNREAKKPGAFDDTSTHVRLSLPSDFDGLWLAPEGKEANWIPTVPGKAWFAYFRFYSPTEAYFDRSWVLPERRDNRTESLERRSMSAVGT